MVCFELFVCKTRRNAGPHSVVCLLFSFQRPSYTLGFEFASSSRALTAAESRRQPFCVKGEVIYFHFPASSRRSEEETSGDLPDLRPLFLTQVPGVRQVAIPKHLRFGTPRVGAASTPTRPARQASLPEMSDRLGIYRLGALLLLLLAPPVKLRYLRHPTVWGICRLGALLLPPLAPPVKLRYLRYPAVWGICRLGALLLPPRQWPVKR